MGLVILAVRSCRNIGKMWRRTASDASQLSVSDQEFVYVGHSDIGTALAGQASGLRFYQ